MQLSDFVRVDCGRDRPPQPFPVLPRLGQASPITLPQNLSFEIGEDRQQTGHRSTGGRSQVQCLGQ